MWQAARRWIVWLAAATLLASCGSPSKTPTDFPAPTPTQPPGLAIDCWVDDSSPALGSDVSVFFNLLNYGTPINGLMMEVNWHQGGALQTCVNQVQFELGMCAIHVADLEAGIYVPITVSTDYIGWTFLGYTGFTPQ
jgi:hypothetical protein